MLIVPDVQDVYTPLQTDVLVPLSEVQTLAVVSSHKNNNFLIIIITNPEELF